MAHSELPLSSPAADRLVDDGERIEIAGLRIRGARDSRVTAPARSFSSAIEFDPAFVFGGDVLFAGSIGRTDLGGNMPQLLLGIRAKLFPLPDTTVVYPGHGPATTIGAEKRSNPFVGESSPYFDRD